LGKLSERIFNLDGRIRVVGVFTKTGDTEEIMVRPDIKETYMPMDLIKQFGPRLATLLRDMVERMRPWHGETSWVIFSQERVNLIATSFDNRIITVTSGKSAPPDALAEKIRNGLREIEQSRT